MTTSTTERILSAAAEARAGAAQARAGAGRQVTGRPSQRRAAEDPSARPFVQVRAKRMDLRAAGEGDGLLHFTGYASIYDRSYEMWDMFGPYDEQVSSGAGAKSLAKPDLDVPLVLQHDPMRRIARTSNGTLTVEERVEEFGGETVSGLWVDAPALDSRDPDVAYIAPKLRDNGGGPLIDEMSFRFQIVRGEWSPDWMEYHITEYDIDRGDTSIVAYGANPFTKGSGLRAPALADMTDAQLRQLERDLHRIRADRGLSTAPPAQPAPPAVARVADPAADLDRLNALVALD